MLSIVGAKGKSRGFTLIELMIVIAIIGILAAILTPILIRARFKTYHAACTQNARNIASALELYAIENKQLYPSALNTLATGPKPFLAAIPNCPSNDITYDTTYSTTGDFREYTASCPGIHELQLPGLVDDLFPQAHNGEVYQYRLP